MEVVNQRSALLSNFEVLTLLRELESDHLARTRTALRIKKEEESVGSPTKNHAPIEEVLENLRTIEVEAIQYLAADYQPTASQTEAGIQQLTRGLSPYNLNKAEKLQIVNLAPTEAVELYVIVEELEDRFGARIDDILSTVRESLTQPAPAASRPSPVVSMTDRTRKTEEKGYAANDIAWDYEENELVFDDTGEGAGIEGDLDVEDD
ncbi:hypothetical protein PHLCEN_2v5564 [Hermanssonia centrifuga]|uniref:DNA-directed RNA polymerase III subunit RPC9 n=1 Tax=Hermanssonia centrifuga TaxID=98765 RepID=A0A2R6P223_9APHY|nr:hypothetical protein PHLCEN_2v5564 [Hermanssonia centrifuga]